MHRRQGLTLIELMVVLIVLGIIFTIVGVNLNTKTEDSRITDTFTEEIRSLRMEALHSGRPISKTMTLDSVSGIATAYPDGRVLSTVGHIEEMTGRPRP